MLTKIISFVTQRRRIEQRVLAVKELIELTECERRVERRIQTLF